MIIASRPRLENQEGPRFRRPVPSRIVSPWPRTESNRMTIGIGMLCTHGAIIAADTRIAQGDGSTHLAQKVHSVKSANGAFVIAYAAEDANATRTLRDDLFEDLVAGDPCTLRETEEIVRPRMARWAAAYTHHLPEMELILGASTPAPWVPEREKRGGVGLYFCQPPNTMLLKHFLEPDTSTYIAIGGGAAITDPVYKSLFGGMTNPKECLKQVAYLLYRAKKDQGQFCGGYSTAFFLRENGPAAFEVHAAYMDKAENAGMMLDQGLKLACSALQASSFAESEEFLKLVRDYLGIMKNYRSLKFVTQFSQEIFEHGVRPSDSQTSEDQ